MTLGEVLTNLACALETVARKADAIDEAVGDMIVDGPEAMTALPAALLQDVDLLRQTTDCLHILMKNLARHADCACAVSREDAGEGVYLASLREACLKGR